MFDTLAHDETGEALDHRTGDPDGPGDPEALDGEAWDLESLDADGLDVDGLDLDALEVIDPHDGGAPPGRWRHVPESIASMRPGIFLAAALFSIDPDAVSGHDRIRMLVAHQRMVSHYQARLYADMASVPGYLRDDEEHGDGDDEDRYGLAEEAAATEIRAALRLTRRSADHELSLALELQRRLPVVWDALVAGTIDVRRARVIVHGTGHLTDTAARDVVATVIDRAGEWTTGQLAARLRRACIEVDPGDAKDRYNTAVAERRVVMEPTTDGTAHLHALDLPPDRAAAATNHINALARSLRGGGETRTMDQLRADVLLDLLTGTTTTEATPTQGVVDLRVDLATLAGLSETPGDLGGYGPVIADLARHITDQHHDAEWRWTLTHPDTGLPIANGTTRRRPTAAQRRSIQTRDVTCIFPGCRMPSTGCDIDHRTPWTHGGPTTECNCGPLCRHDHGHKTRHRWTYQPLPNGDYLWTSPLHHHYTTSGKPP